MKRIEHLGIAVENLEKAIPLFETLLNTPCYKEEEAVSYTHLTLPTIYAV